MTIENDYLANSTWHQLQSRDDVEISIDDGETWQQLDDGCIIRQATKKPTTRMVRMWLGQCSDNKYQINVEEETVKKYLLCEEPKNTLQRGKFIRWIGYWNKVEA